MHGVSKEDRTLAEAIRLGRLSAADFGHREHVRMAYICLAEAGPGEAFRRMRGDLLRFLAHHRVPPGKYHETLTRAWMVVVRHCMERTPDTGSSGAFIERNPGLLDTDLLLTHYSKQRLFSDEARMTYLPPDRTPFPLNGDARDEPE